MVVSFLEIKKPLRDIRRDKAMRAQVLDTIFTNRRLEYSLWTYATPRVVQAYRDYMLHVEDQVSHKR